MTLDVVHPKDGDIVLVRCPAGHEVDVQSIQAAAENMLKDGVKVLFIVLPEGGDLTLLTDNELKRCGLQRIPKKKKHAEST